MTDIEVKRLLCEIRREIHAKKTHPRSRDEESYVNIKDINNIFEKHLGDVDERIRRSIVKEG